jgi:hypothetical protein
MSPRLFSFRHAAFLLTALLTASGCTDDGDPNETAKETPGLDDTGGAPETSPEGAPGIVVKETTGLKTTEAGGTATFTIVLALKPTSDVTIVLTSSKPTEGNVDKSKVVFTTDNWDAPQTVTITGVDDTATDGAQDYSIVTAPAVSADPRYNGLDADDVAVSNADDETAGITVQPITGLKTTEMGDEATFTIRLNTKPTGDVVIPLSSSNDKEGTVSPASLTFTASNWSAPQTVTVKGVDDTTADGTQTYKIVTAAAKSSDSAYNGMDADDVTLTNIDDESPGFRVTPTAGLSTTEAGGTATFTVRLNSKPTADVTIPLSSSKVTEGTVAPASLVFTTDNWSAPQTVTITGVDDSAADGTQAYTIVTGVATSTDTGYAGLNPDDVAVSNVDDESAGFTITPVSGLITNEGGGTATFTIRLNSKPNGTVVVPLSSSNTKEGTVGPSSITFTADNWNAPQTVTVTGVDDATTDGAQTYKIVTGVATGTDTSGYVGMDPADVSVSNTDNDSPGFSVSPAIATTESGGTSLFSVRLNAQPKGTVTIPLTSSDTTEGTVAATSLTFDETNWSTLQYVTVTGVDDFVADGNQPYTIQLGVVTGSDTSGYVGLNPPDVALSNTDNDSAGITVTVPAAGLTTSEAGGVATFTLKLNSQPTANVTIPLSSTRVAEGTISPASVTFTAANWNVAQTVTLTGVDDSVADGNQVYAAKIGPSTSTDTAYNNLDPADPAVTNTDNDAAGVIVTPTSGLVTTEAGGTASFTVVLTSAPTATVSVSVASSNSLEGTLSIKAVSFDATNWNKAQTVTITGVDDSAIDGAVAYTIITGAAVSTDPKYSGLAVSDVSVVNTDNELDCRITSCGGSCAEIHKRFPALADGNYMITATATKPFTVYCHNMVGGGFEYLNVDPSMNYSAFADTGRCAAACGGFIVYFDKLRFDPFAFTINTADRTFTTQKGGTAACYKGAGCYPYTLNYASAAACESYAGAGRANLGKNPFVFNDKTFLKAAVVGVGESFTHSFSLDRRSVDITGGAKGCSSYGFSDGGTSSPVANPASPLTYSPP